MNKRYQVFVSSTYADLKDERSKVIQTIMELDCIPAGMEIFPAIDEEQFEFIKKVIDDCDYYILIIGGRYGTLSEDGISYTEKEYNYAIQKGIKVIAFVHSNPDSIAFNKSEINIELREKLDAFRTNVSTNRLIKFWENANQLPGLVALSLSKTIKTYPAIGWVRANIVADPNIYKEMSDIRKENQELKTIIDQKLQEEEKAEDLNLASLNDKIIISGTNRYYSSGHKTYYTEDWKIELTWGKIFALISPHLLKPSTDVTAKNFISEVLYDAVENRRSTGTVYINDQDFQTIKIHLRSLNLIDIEYTKTLQGGADLFWSLTDKGNNLLTKLRSVKKN